MLHDFERVIRGIGGDYVFSFKPPQNLWDWARIAMEVAEESA